VTLACDWAIPVPPDSKSFDPGQPNVQLTLDGAREQVGGGASRGERGKRKGWLLEPFERERVGAKDDFARLGVD
jgi:hypothetical protein